MIMARSKCSKSKLRRTYNIRIETCIKIDKIAIVSGCDKSTIVDHAIDFFCDDIVMRASIQKKNYRESILEVVDEEKKNQN